MGIYVNPSDCDKETWLCRYGEIIMGQGVSRAPSTYKSGDCLAVCLVDNGGFTAAGVAYNESELASFAYPDGRDKVWFWVPLSALAEVTGLTAEQLLRAGDEA